MLNTEELVSSKFTFVKLSDLQLVLTHYFRIKSNLIADTRKSTEKKSFSSLTREKSDFSRELDEFERLWNSEKLQEDPTELFVETIDLIIDHDLQSLKFKIDNDIGMLSLSLSN